MRFHCIEIANINSLYGEHCIDIDQNFADVPLYLIMGPTGSGKTTILDAVCLALFGTTPRQLSADGGAAGVGAMVNSHGTGRSRAIVEFSLLDAAQSERTRYRAQWEFWRAHDRPYETPQDPRRELSFLGEDGQWQTIVSSRKQKEYEEAFDRVLDGMTLHDFLRSVMLAQGEFAALLEASDAEKASILERLTDTGDYQRLGRLAHRRWQKERDKLQRLDDRVESFEGASAEDILATEAALETRRQDLRDLEQCKEAASARRQWLSRAASLDSELEDAREKLAAAKKEREEHAEAFSRRQADHKAQRASKPLEAVRRLEAETKELGEKLPDLEEAKDERKQTLDTARDGENRAKEALEAAEEAFEALKPKLEEAKKVKNDLKNKRQQGKKASEQLTSLRKAFRRSKKSVETSQKTLERVTTRRDEAAKELEEMPNGEALVGALAALESEREALAKSQERVDRGRNKVEKLDEVIKKTAARQDKLDTRLEAKKQQLEPLQEAAEKAGKALAAALGGADKPRKRQAELTEQLKALAGRQDAVDKLAALVEQRADKLGKRGELDQQLEDAQEAASELEEQLEADQKRRTELREELADKQRDIDEVGQRLLAAELRRTILPGEACPVCGGEDHPKLEAHGTDMLDEQEKLDEAEKSRLESDASELGTCIEELAERIDKTTSALNEATPKLARLEANLESADTDLEKLDEAIDQAADDAGDAVSREAIDGDEAAAHLKKARSELRERAGELEQKQSDLDAAQDTLEEAEAALEEARTGLDELEEKRKDLGRSLENACDQRESATEELEHLEQDFGQAQQRLIGKFEDAGVVVRGGDEPDFDAALARAKDELASWRKANEVLEKATNAVDKARKAVEQAELNRDHERSKLDDGKDALEEIDAKVAELEDELEAKLDGRDPDQVEAHHQKTIKSARKEREKAADSRQEAEKAFQKASDDLDRAHTRRKKLSEKLVGARTELDEAIAAIEDIDDIEQLEAALLEDDERERVDELCERIETELHDAGRDIERLENTLKEHADAKPADFEPDAYSVDSLQAAERQLREAIDAYNQKVGALEKQLEHMRDMLESYRSLVAERDAQQQEFDGWNELNTLIGVSNGERFKQFAQALNLDRIVDRANRRLTELHPRYRLKTRHDEASGLPTLDFEVVDRYHAGKRRPLTTLSGGETFLVSLALALALADQQRIKMPIETLFLDEGFGTLDRDALQKALDILNNLHARAGRTVGVISHVEALKEQIAAQILVEPQQDGRSTVTIPQQ